MARIGNIEGKIESFLVADKCPICKQMCEINVHFKQKIFVLGLPMFPHEKYKIIECKTCKGIIKEKNAPAYVKQLIAKEFPKAKTIKAAYIGSAIMGVIVIAALVLGIKTTINNADYIAQPQIGDQYIIHYEDNSAIFNKDRYTKWKVVGYNDKQVLFVQSPLESSEKDNIVINKNSIDGVWIYEDTFQLIREDLENMNSILEDYRIEEIVRYE